MNQFRFAFRLFAKNRGFTATVILTLALAIGANTTIFSVINTTFLRALPYPGQERIMFLAERVETSEISLSYPNFLDWHAQQDVFAALAAYTIVDETLQTAETAEQIPVALVSAEFFRVLGVNPIHGRALNSADDLPGAAPVAWITQPAWHRLFGGDPGLVGRSITLEGEAVVVAGILPAGFRFIRPADFYRPLAPLADRRNMRIREDHTGAFGLGRLRDGLSLETARAHMTAIEQRLRQDYPKANSRLEVTVVPLRERISRSARTELSLLLGAVGLVLLIACVNVANMLLARAVAREREMAIRTALGGSRSQLMRQLLVESLVLAMAGGLLGLFLCQWGVKYARLLVPWEVQMVSGAGAEFDVRVLLFTAAVTLLTGIGFGLAPAWRLSQTSPNAALKMTRRAARTRFGLLHLTDGLAGAQVALALVLLIGAGLLLRSLRQLTQVDPGFQPDRLLTLRVTEPAQGRTQADPFASYTYAERILQAVRTLPQVEAAAFGTSVPFTWNLSTPPVYREGAPIPFSGAELPEASCHYVSTDYFRTLGIPLLRGRVFDGHEIQPSLPPRVEVSGDSLRKYIKDFVFDGVINRRMAQQLWPGEDPLGKRFRIGTPDMELPLIRVIGVVGNTTQQGLERGEQAEFYFALRQLSIRVQHLLVRSRGDPAPLVASVRAAIRSAAPGESVFDVKPMSERVADSLQDRRFNADLYVAFAGAALVLAIIGIYGVLAFTVSQRRREMGIRIALGARRSDILRKVLGRGLALIVPGIGVGLGGAWAVSRLLQTQLFGIDGTDPLTFGVAAILLLFAALAGCCVPAQRAASVDPLVALRDE